MSTKPKHKTVCHLAVIGVVIGAVGVIAPALHELGLALSAFSLCTLGGVWAARRGLKLGLAAGVAAGVVLFMIFARGYKDNPSIKDYLERSRAAALGRKG